MKIVIARNNLAREHIGPNTASMVQRVIHDTAVLEFWHICRREWGYLYK